MNWLSRTGEVLLGPRVAFGRVLGGGEGGVGDVLLLMGFCMLGTAPVEVAMVLTGTGGVLVRILSMYMRFCLLPLVVCVALALAVAGILRFRGRRLPIERLLTASVYLWIPVGMLGLLGSMLRALGLDLWFLPHMPLGFFLHTQPAWWMILLRAACSYGWSAALFWVLLMTIPKESGEEVPRNKAGRFVLAGWVLLSYLVGGAFVGIHYDSIRPVRAGDRAPGFELQRAGSPGTIQLSSLSGRPVLVDFWGVWCPKCVEHMDELVEFARSHPEVAVLAVHQGGTAEEVGAFVAGKKWSGVEFLLDDLGLASGAYRADSVPAYFAIGPDGTVRAVRFGVPPRGWLEEHVRLK